MVKITDAGARQAINTGESHAKFTIPNVVTILRFFIVPVFSVTILRAGNYEIALLLLILLGATDWADGYLARRLNQVSQWGKILDPLADRISLILIFATLVIVGIIPWFVIVGIVGIDATIAFTALLLKASSSLEVTVAGKVRTALLLIGVSLLLIAQGIWDNTAVTIFAYSVFYAGCIGHVWAGFGYFLTLLRKKTSVFEQTTGRL